MLKSLMQNEWYLSLASGSVGRVSSAIHRPGPTFITQTSKMPHTSTPSIWKMEAGEPGAQSHTQLYSELKASLGYMTP